MMMMMIMMIDQNASCGCFVTMTYVIQGWSWRHDDITWVFFEIKCCLIIHAYLGFVCLDTVQVRSIWLFEPNRVESTWPLGSHTAPLGNVVGWFFNLYYTGLCLAPLLGLNPDTTLLGNVWELWEIPDFCLRFIYLVRWCGWIIVRRLNSGTKESVLCVRFSSAMLA